MAWGGVRPNGGRKRGPAKIRLTLNLETSFLDVVDKARGELNRSEFLNAAVAVQLDFMEQNRRKRFPARVSIWWKSSRPVALKLDPPLVERAAALVESGRVGSMTDLVRMAGIRAAGGGA